MTRPGKLRRLSIYGDPWSVTYVPANDDAVGLCHWTEHRIEIQGRMEPEAEADILLHEMAHAYWYATLNTNGRLSCEGFANLFARAVKDLVRANPRLVRRIEG